MRFSRQSNNSCNINFCALCHLSLMRTRTGRLIVCKATTTTTTYTSPQNQQVSDWGSVCLCNPNSLNSAGHKKKHFQISNENMKIPNCTGVGWHVASQPSSCGWTPSGLSCSWTHCPLPSCKGCGTYDDQSSWPPGTCATVSSEHACGESRWFSVAYEHWQYLSSCHTPYVGPSSLLHQPHVHEHDYVQSGAFWWSIHPWQVFGCFDLKTTRQQVFHRPIRNMAATN